MKEKNPDTPIPGAEEFQRAEDAYIGLLNSYREKHGVQADGRMIEDVKAYFAAEIKLGVSGIKPEDPRFRKGIGLALQLEGIIPRDNQEQANQAFDTLEQAVKLNRKLFEGMVGSTRRRRMQLADIMDDMAKQRAKRPRRPRHPKR